MSRINEHGKIRAGALLVGIVNGRVQAPLISRADFCREVSAGREPEHADRVRIDASRLCMKAHQPLLTLTISYTVFPCGGVQEDRMKLSISACAALAVMCTSAFAADTMKISTLWATSADVPADLQLACVSDAKTLQASRTCPVIRYQGVTTWVFSYKDNRTSLAMVSYDGDGKVIRTMEHAGARYVAGMSWDKDGQTVTIKGEEGKTITVPWSELGT